MIGKTTTRPTENHFATARNEEQLHCPTSTTKNRANVGHAVSSQFTKFGFGRKDAGIKALFCVGGERWRT